MEKFVRDTSVTGALRAKLYRLTSVIATSCPGNSCAGMHCHTYCRWSDERWFNFDNESVNEVTKEKALSESALILVYTRIERKKKEVRMQL